MLILAFESSARAASAALVRDGKLLSQVSQCSGLTHSRTLLPMAESMLQTAGISLSQIDRFAVACGPGSFWRWSHARAIRGSSAAQKP